VVTLGNRFLTAIESRTLAFGYRRYSRPTLAAARLLVLVDSYDAEAMRRWRAASMHCVTVIDSINVGRSVGLLVIVHAHLDREIAFHIRVLFHWGFGDSQSHDQVSDIPPQNFPRRTLRLSACFFSAVHCFEIQQTSSIMSRVKVRVEQGSFWRTTSYYVASRPTCFPSFHVVKHRVVAGIKPATKSKSRTNISW